MRKRGRGRPRRFGRAVAREIRRLVKSGRPVAEVAAKYEASTFTILQVVRATGAYANTL